MTQAAASSTPSSAPSSAPAGPAEAHLTALELDCALALIDAPQPSITALAAGLDLHPSQLLEILARPHVIQWAEAALAVEHTRDDLLARRAHSTALQTLAEVARDTTRDPVERRRAATSILRASQRPRRCPPGDPDAPADQTAPLAALKQLETASLAPPEDGQPEPDCAEILKSIPASLARGSVADPESFKPIQQRCARTLREATLLEFLARTQLHHAAGARLTDHHLFEIDGARGMQATFEAEDGPVTFHIICHNFGVAAERWRITEIVTIDQPQPDPEIDVEYDDDEPEPHYDGHADRAQDHQFDPPLDHQPDPQSDPQPDPQLDPDLQRKLISALQFAGAPPRSVDAIDRSHSPARPSRPP